MTPIDAEIVIAQLNVKIEKAQKGLLEDYGHPSTMISVLSDLRTLVTNLPRIAADITAPPLTNADRIRQMTDEELADVIGFNECKDTAHGYECPAWIQPHCDGECKKHFLTWLKQEVSGDVGKTD